MNVIARTLRACVATLCIAAAAQAGAATSVTNFSDLWWNPTESGWGVNVAQQADLMYVTFYVYGPGGQPTWHSALLAYQGTQPDGSALFSGPLSSYTGPFFGGPYNPAEVTQTNVGNATFRATSSTSATLTYNVGAAQLVKPLERFLLRADTLTGDYLGGTSDITSNCTPAANNGFRSEESGVFTVSHVGSFIQIRGPRCTYAGNLEQHGQVSHVDASYTCADGAFGSVSFFELRAEIGGITGRYTGTGSGCTFDGNIGIARRK